MDRKWVVTIGGMEYHFGDEKKAINFAHEATIHFRPSMECMVCNAKVKEVKEKEGN